MNSFIIPSFLLFALLSCTNSHDQHQIVKFDTVVKQHDAPTYIGATISWLDSSQVTLAIDRQLSYINKKNFFDSALAIDYVGYAGEHTFFPINDSGRWISTIRKTTKLTQQQNEYVISVIGDRKSYLNPLVIPCFEPRYGIIYFRNGKVIGQTAICLGCARLVSTIRTGDPKQEGLLNENGRERLNILCKELQFTDCHN